MFVRPVAHQQGSSRFIQLGSKSFLAVNDQTLFASLDGLTWNDMIFPGQGWMSTNRLIQVACGTAGKAIVSSYGRKYWITHDYGGSWEVLPETTISGLSALANHTVFYYCAGRFFSQTNNNYSWSDDLLSWTQGSLPASIQLGSRIGYAAAKQRYYFLNTLNSLARNVYESANLATWSVKAAISRSNPFGFGVNQEGDFVIPYRGSTSIQFNDATVLDSSDGGITWTDVVTHDGGYGSMVAKTLIDVDGTLMGALSPVNTSSTSYGGAGLLVRSPTGVWSMRTTTATTMADNRLVAFNDAAVVTQAVVRLTSTTTEPRQYRMARTGTTLAQVTQPMEWAAVDAFKS